MRLRLRYPSRRPRDVCTFLHQCVEGYITPRPPAFPAVRRRLLHGQAGHLILTVPATCRPVEVS